MHEKSEKSHGKATKSGFYSVEDIFFTDIKLRISVLSFFLKQKCLQK